jgi:hypothetical protein
MLLSINTEITTVGKIILLKYQNKFLLHHNTTDHHLKLEMLNFNIQSPRFGFMNEKELDLHI